MDLTQRKLTKEEWESLEVPLPIQEVKILKMISNSFENVNNKFNDTYSLNKYMKVTDNFDLYDLYFYNTYFKKGLPPSPICMPDLSTILAVLNPETHSFLYFVADPDNSGFHLFSKSLVQHNRNKRKYINWLNKKKLYR